MASPLTRPKASSPAGSVALAHDYLTQRGGAERVALVMAEAFTGSPLYTTLYDPAATFPGFGSLEVHASGLNRIAALRSRHRLALPLLAPVVSSMHIDADVLLTSSSGWAHGLSTSGRKVVYCHSPARWLYQQDRYLGVPAGDRGRLRQAPAQSALGVLGSSLRRWDRRAAASADRYLANSTVTRDAIRAIYGIEAEILPPPPALVPGGIERAVEGVEPGYFLCVARLLPYKNVDAVIGAVSRISGARLVVVGDGPERAHLTALAAATPGVTLLGRVADDQLSWLYHNCSALVAASFEDYGLSPLEAAAFGKPSVVLRAGGYLDTVVSGCTGIFFDRPVAGDIASALEFTTSLPWDAPTMQTHAASFSTERFQKRLQEIVAEELLQLKGVPAV
jgi:glycosyltransferase involved in cell wall biosynthesis